ncbi:unnamed protein product, partial [Musa hybrid cultivar]
GVRDCNLCSLREAVSEGGRRAAANVFQKKNANCSLQKDMETELARISLKHGHRNADCLP